LAASAAQTTITPQTPQAQAAPSSAATLRLQADLAAEAQQQVDSAAVTQAIRSVSPRTSPQASARRLQQPAAVCLAAREERARLEASAEVQLADLAARTTLQAQEDLAQQTHQVR
jgi:hypothetical protein